MIAREYMPENDAPLDAPIEGITPAMIDAGAMMAAEVFRGKVTEGDARLWVGEIYAAMRAMAPMMTSDEFDDEAEALVDQLQARGSGIIGETDPWVAAIADALRDAYGRGRDSVDGHLDE